MIIDFRNSYYYPDYIKLIQNIINKCNLCNLSKHENRQTDLPYEITPTPNNIRDKYIIDYFFTNIRSFLTCIDLKSKFLLATETTSTDWIETKKALLKVFNLII